MTTLPFFLSAPDPLSHLFQAREAVSGGVMRLPARDMDARIGPDRLRRAVARRGFHLFRSGADYVIVCRPGPIRQLA